MPRSFRDHDSESEEDDDDEIVFDVSKYDFIDDDDDEHEDNIIAEDNDDQPSKTINPPEESKPPEKNNPSLSSKNTSKPVDEKVKPISSVSNSNQGSAPSQNATQGVSNQIPKFRPHSPCPSQYVNNLGILVAKMSSDFLSIRQKISTPGRKDKLGPDSIFAKMLKRMPALIDQLLKLRLAKITNSAEAGQLRSSHDNAKNIGKNIEKLSEKYFSERNTDLQNEIVENIDKMKATLFGLSKNSKKAMLKKAQASLKGVAPSVSNPAVSSIPATGDLRAYLSKRSQRPVPPSGELKSQPITLTTGSDRSPLKQHDVSQQRFKPKRGSETRSQRTLPPSRKTLSPRLRQSFSPRRFSPPRRTLSPRSRFAKRRSPSPRLPRRTRSPRQPRLSSPRRTPPSRSGHSLSPIRTQTQGHFSTSPPRRSPSPRFQRSLSPIRTQLPGPHYDFPPRQRSPSPRVRVSLSPVRTDSPISFKISPRRLRRSPSPPGRLRSFSPTFQQTQQGSMLTQRPMLFPSPRRAFNPLPVEFNNFERSLTENIPHQNQVDQQQAEETMGPSLRLVVEERDNFIRSQEHLLSPRTRQIYEERVSLRVRTLEIGQEQPASRFQDFDDREKQATPMHSSHPMGQFIETKVCSETVLGLPLPRPAMSKMESSGFSESLNMPREADEQVHLIQKDPLKEAGSSTESVGLPLPRPAISRTNQSAYSEALNMQKMLEDQVLPTRKDHLKETNEESFVLPLPRPSMLKPEHSRYSEGLKMQTFLTEQVEQIRTSVRGLDQVNLNNPEQSPALPCPRPAGTDSHRNVYSEKLEDPLNVDTKNKMLPKSDRPSHPYSPVSRMDESVYSEALKMQELLEEQSHRLVTNRNDLGKDLNQKSKPPSSSNQLIERQIEKRINAATLENFSQIVPPIKPKQNEVSDDWKVPKLEKDLGLRQANKPFLEALRLQELLEEQTKLRSYGILSEEAKNSSLQGNQQQQRPPFLQKEDTRSREEMTEKNISPDQILRGNISSVDQSDISVETSGYRNLSPGICCSVGKSHLDFEEERAQERQLVIQTREKKGSSEVFDKSNVKTKSTHSPTSEKEQEWIGRKRQHAPGDDYEANSKELCKEKYLRNQFNPFEILSQHLENVHENHSIITTTLTLDHGPKTPEPEMQLILPKPTHSSYEVNPRQTDFHSMAAETNKDAEKGFDWDLLKQDQSKESTSIKPEKAKNRLKKAANLVRSKNQRSRTPEDEMQVILPKPTYSSANNSHLSKIEASIIHSKESRSGFDWDLLKQDQPKESKSSENRNKEEEMKIASNMESEEQCQSNERTRKDSETSLSSFSSLSIISGSSSIVELTPLRAPQPFAEQHPKPMKSRRQQKNAWRRRQPPSHFITPPLYGGGLPPLPVMPHYYDGTPLSLPIMPQYTNAQLYPQPETTSSTVQWEAQTNEFLKSIGAKTGRHSRERRRTPTPKRLSRSRSRSRERQKKERRREKTKPSSSKPRDEKREKGESSTTTKTKVNVEPSSSQVEGQKIQEKAETGNKSEIICICCLARTHVVKDCSKFSGLSVTERWTIVRHLSVKFCVRCLDVGHFVEECNDKKKKTTNRWSEVCCDRFHALMHNCSIKPIESAKPVAKSESVIDAINQKNAEINEKIQLLKLSQEIEKAERLKRKEAEKNQAESDKLGMEHKLQQMLKEQQTQNQALMEKLKDANGKAEKYMEICSKCRSDRHRVADCPLNFCKSCGEQGHESNNCRHSNLFQRREEEKPESTLKPCPPPPPSISRPSTSKDSTSSSDYGRHFEQPSKQQQHSEECRDALWEHYLRRLLDNRKDPALAKKMMDFWRLAGHDHSTLSNFVSKNCPENRNLLRLLLVSELVKAPSSSYPAGVSVDFLLDETVNFFLPPDDHREESRVLSLKPLQAYVSGKMRTMAGIFGINEEYISRVSSGIQMSLAEVGFGLDELKRHYTVHGKDSLNLVLMEKMTSSKSVTLPKGVTPKYVATMVSDFVMDYCK